MQKRKSSSFAGSFSKSAYLGTASNLQDIAEAELAKAQSLAEQARAESDPARRRVLIEQAREAALTARSVSEKVKQLVK
ncbi:hypothetical protein SAMN06265365_12778 [Tistlia consotensis]|uniref:Uncharacterized protein n=1 Tax=Tistlia consotensis USBA 355 TaxID=560819 RepID=A0A1Y6CKU4_9PROT|nr:hypothetical protein [Tistlia consotensis]SMF69614.1 hypothetical protein SAMN05428998_1292 [Tistlia consotensis USBA 355]SNS05628.1 hypothetical protein SAMN06265365_12778 [Tistlia consotensis]